MKKLVGIVVVFALGFVAGILWYRESPGGSPSPVGPTPSDPILGADRPALEYADVTVRSGPNGRFGGSITLTNNTNRSVTVLATVHVYDGPDNIADLSESTTMKPMTTSTVDLSSFDDYATFTDTTVDLLPWG